MNSLQKILSLVLLVGAASTCNARSSEFGHPTFLSPHYRPIVVHEDQVFVVNTPADTVDVINRDTLAVDHRIPVGIDPVALALRPDGKELWVSNHVSDSVSIIDLDPARPTHLRVIATIQDLVSGVTRFDEPVGIAFADNSKAYVALSSENQVAVIDTDTRQVLSTLTIPAQDPRAIEVRGGRLYVLPFESNNQTQISGCTGPLNGDLCTFDATEHVITNNNVLSRNAVVDIVKNPAIPDRDLFVFDTSTDALVQTISGVGTLLYGMAVDAEGGVYVAQTDARNDVNGRAGTLGDGLAEMGNRPFLNQVTHIQCETSCAHERVLDLEPAPPIDPQPGRAVATPYALTLSADDATLIGTAAGSNRLFTMNASSGEILGMEGVGEVPRGIVVESDTSGVPQTAWVFNAGDNSVNRVDLRSLAAPSVTATISLEDPTPLAIKRGRAAFNDASASTSQTFSCESCHPDGGTDQLLWVLDTPPCNIGGCDQIPPRITMPVRGLRDTAPYHWDGIPGDPYGGSNTANVFGNSAPNCSVDNPASCTRNLLDGALASTMCKVGMCGTNDEGKPGGLSAEQRNDMAQFLLSIPYPPAQRRSTNNVLSARAKSGFSLFHIEGDLQGNPQPNVCGDCHRMPFWVSTNTPGTGMDAPTWRGAYDRWLILPQGRLNIIDFDFYRFITGFGTPERNMWRFSWASRTRFDPVWDMVLEGSTGYSGAFARQVTLDSSTANLTTTVDTLNALEQAAAERAVVLTLDAAVISGSPSDETLTYNGQSYVAASGTRLSRDQILAQAVSGAFTGTFTGRTGILATSDHAQPAIWTRSPLHLQTGRQPFPILRADNRTLRVSGRHVMPGAHVIVDGRRIAGNVRCSSGELPDCSNEAIEVEMLQQPAEAGMHFLQLQNPDGLVSNDFIFHTEQAGQAAGPVSISGAWIDADAAGHGWFLERLAGVSPGDPDRVTAYWYVYNDGAPVWIIGQGIIEDGIAELEAFVTQGAQFPPQFSAADVELIPWGSLSLEFANDTTANVTWRSPLSPFARGSTNIESLAPVSSTAVGCRSGSFYNPDQAGHGIVVQVVSSAEGEQMLVSWYTYVDGEQVWLLGQTSAVNDNPTTIAMRQYGGADFPPGFDTNAVTSEPWGNVTLTFTDPQTMSLSWNATDDGFGDGAMQMTRLSRLKRCASL